MATIVTRAGKGAPLTNTELDANFTGLNSELGGKAASAHTHLKADVTDLSLAWTEITGKPSTFAPSAHVHSGADITTGTVAAARLPSGTTSASGVVQLSSSTSSTSTTLAATASAVKSAYDLANGKAAAAHTHAIADVTGLQTALDGKSSTSHTHAYQTPYTVTTTATGKTLAVRERCTVTAAGQTITLPASPSAGDEVTVLVGAFADTIIARNGQNLMSLAEDMTINAQNVGITLLFVDATRGWRII